LALIAKTVEFVRQHPNSNVEERIFARDAGRFAFLQQKHPWHGFYRRALLGERDNVEQSAEYHRESVTPSSHVSPTENDAFGDVLFARFLAHKEFFPALCAAHKATRLGGSPSEWQRRRRQLRSAPTALELEATRTVALYVALQEQVSQRAPPVGRPGAAGPESHQSQGGNGIQGEKTSSGSTRARDISLEFPELIESDPRLLSFLLPQHVYHPIFSGFLHAFREIIRMAIGERLPCPSLSQLDRYNENEWAVFSDALHLVQSQRDGSSAPERDVPAFVRLAQAFALGALTQAENIDSVTTIDRLPLIEEARMPQQRPNSAASGTLSKVSRAPTQQLMDLSVGSMSMAPELTKYGRSSRPVSAAAMPAELSGRPLDDDEQSLSGSQPRIFDRNNRAFQTDRGHQHPSRVGRPQPVFFKNAQGTRPHSMQKRPLPYSVSERNLKEQRSSR
jgi:hypothetical protein